MSGNRPMTPFRVTLALLLLVAALVLAAGCVGEQRTASLNTPVFSSTSKMTPVYPEEQRPIPEGKYLFVEHFIRTQWTTLEGNCDSMALFDGPLYILDDRTGNLSVRLCPEEQINASLLMFYGGGWSGSGGVGGGMSSSASPVYALPWQYRDGVTVTQVNSSGFVFLNYQNTSIVLKPKDQLVFNTSRIQKTTEERKGQMCTKEIVTTDIFYHEGIFDTEKIKVSYHEKCWTPK